MSLKDMQLTNSDWNILLRYKPYQYTDKLRSDLKVDDSSELTLLDKILFQFALNDISYSQRALEKDFDKMYRARVYNKSEDSEKVKRTTDPFQGYNEKDSFVPPASKVTSLGRANKKGQVVLYASSSEHGAINEIRPYIGQYVSVAVLEITNRIQLFNMAHYNIGIEASNQKRTDWIQRFILDLAECFYSVNTKDEDYFLCQYIGKKVQSFGFDGIRYYSSKNESNISENAYYNFAIFNYQKCRPVSSTIKYIESVDVKYFQINSI